MKEIWFIRHGESQANAGLATPLPETIALTERGIKQSKYIPAVFTETPDLIITSPFLRTKQTAEPTIIKFPNTKVEEWNAQEFRYLSLTKYADTTTELRRPFIEEYWNRGEADFYDGDGTESFAEFISRVSTLIRKVFETPQKTMAIFTHRQFVNATLWLLINDFPKINNASMKRYYNFLSSVFVPNASIFKIYIDESSRDFRFSSIMTGHLPTGLITF